MRTTEEYLSLQLAYRPERLTAIVAPDTLTTARFETVYREMSGFGMLDLLFERDAELFVAHAVAVDVVVLATREGPALIWPATLHIAPATADAVEELVTPWLLSLVRGRGLAGEYVRGYRPSAAFETARARLLRGAVRNAISLPVMAPFVYARRFAAQRDVRVACAQGAFAAAVIGTVARSVALRGDDDAFARRWFDAEAWSGDAAGASVAIVDEMTQPEVADAPYVVAVRPHDGEHTVIVPIPVPQDHLFTFDPADAPAAARFAVRAADRAERPIRVTDRPAARGGSGGRVALVTRDDAAFASDADTDTADELARRLCAEGLDAAVMTAADPRVAAADLVHISGGLDDAHVAVAAQAARTARIPYYLSVAPLGPYAKYFEDALIATLRLGADETDEQYFLNMFYERRLRFDEVPHELAPAAAAARDSAFETICIDAAGVFLAPCDALQTFRERFPRVPAERVVSAPSLLAQEPPESPVAALVPAERFLLLHTPITRRSSLGHILAALGETTCAVVVAGPISEVDIGFTMRRIGGSQVVFLPDPTPGIVAALYRRAHAVAIPTLRPPGAERLIRATLCGALPLVPRASPLARLVPVDCQFDESSRPATRALLESVMHADVSGRVAQLARVLEPLADQRAAFAPIVEMYARAASATPR